jgi:stearoyl-CoA desaturase (delta-9 desaturase)
MWRPLEYLSALCGTLALQGGPIWWVATHRKHHAHSDKDGDPHDINRGWWWAHIGWLYLPNKDRLEPGEVGRYTKDMINDPIYVFLNRFEVPVQIAFGVLLFVLGGWSWVVWGVFVRLVMVYHVTWLVNSSSHMFGYRTHRTTDKSTNNWAVALLAFGEGWHNNHHAFPFSARHGMSRFEFDPTWLIIRGLSIARLAQAVRVPSAEMRERLRIKPADEVAA